MKSIAEIVWEICPNNVMHLQDLIVLEARKRKTVTRHPIMLLSDKVTGEDKRATRRNQRRNRRRAQFEQAQHPEWIVICSSEIMSGGVRENLSDATYKRLVDMWPHIIERGVIDGIITGPNAHLSIGSQAEHTKARELGLQIVPAGQLPPTLLERVNSRLTPVRQIFRRESTEQISQRDI